MEIKFGQIVFTRNVLTLKFESFRIKIKRGKVKRILHVSIAIKFNKLL